MPPAADISPAAGPGGLGSLQGLAVSPLRRVHEVLQKMQGSVENATGLLACLHALSVLSKDEGNKLLIARDGLPLILSVMRERRSSSPLQAAICDLIWSLAYNNALVKEAVGRMGGVELVVDAMKHHSSQTALLKSACGALSNLCQTGENQMLIAGHGGVERLLAIASRHISEISLLPFVFDALASLVVGNFSTGKKAVNFPCDGGGVGLIVGVIRANMSSREVVKSGSHVLAILSDIPGQGKCTADAGGVSALIPALRLHIGYAPLHRIAAIVLLRMLQEANVGEQVLAAGGVPVLLAMLKKHSAEVETCAATVHILYLITHVDILASRHTHGRGSPLLSTLLEGHFTGAPPESIALLRMPSASKVALSNIPPPDDESLYTPASISSLVQALSLHSERKDVARAGLRCLSNLSRISAVCSYLAEPASFRPEGAAISSSRSGGSGIDDGTTESAISTVLRCFMSHRTSKGASESTLGILKRVTRSCFYELSTREDPECSSPSSLCETLGLRSFHIVSRVSTDCDSDCARVMSGLCHCLAAAPHWRESADSMEDGDVPLAALLFLAMEELLNQWSDTVSDFDLPKQAPSDTSGKLTLDLNTQQTTPMISSASRARRIQALRQAAGESVRAAAGWAKGITSGFKADTENLHEADSLSLVAWVQVTRRSLQELGLCRGAGVLDSAGLGLAVNLPATAWSLAASAPDDRCRQLLSGLARWMDPSQSTCAASSPPTESASAPESSLVTKRIRDSAPQRSRTKPTTFTLAMPGYGSPSAQQLSRERAAQRPAAAKGRRASAILQVKAQSDALNASLLSESDAPGDAGDDEGEAVLEDDRQGVKSPPPMSSHPQELLMVAWPEREPTMKRGDSRGNSSVNLASSLMTSQQQGMPVQPPPAKLWQVYEGESAAGMGVRSHVKASEPYVLTQAQRGLSAATCPYSHSLSFESCFESGNLLRAVQRGDSEYDLMLRADLHTHGHTQWFYFAVTLTHPPECAEGQEVTVKFNIINLTKPGSMYNQGMRPVMYSQLDAQERSRGWRRCAHDISYRPNIYPCAKPDGSSGAFYTLSFSVTFPRAGDRYLLAHCFPYTLSDHRRHLSCLMADARRARCITRTSLCETLGRQQCDLLTITEGGPSREKEGGRRIIVISARVHPGEVPASWMMRGILNFLTGDSPDARILRKNFIFQIVPMLNPDGVVHGSNRCSLAGVDLNRQWRRPSRMLHPTIWNLKNIIRAGGKQVAMYMDLHGHSRKANIFLYGVDERKRGLSRPAAREFPKLACWNRFGRKYMSFKDCSFAVKKGREATARVVVARELGITSYTVESTFSGVDFGPLADCHLNVDHLQEAGCAICDTLLDYYNLRSQLEEEIPQSMPLLTNDDDEDNVVDDNDDIESESDSDSIEGEATPGDEVSPWDGPSAVEPVPHADETQPGSSRPVIPHLKILKQHRSSLSPGLKCSRPLHQSSSIRRAGNQRWISGATLTLPIQYGRSSSALPATSPGIMVRKRSAPAATSIKSSPLSLDDGRERQLLFVMSGTSNVSGLLVSSSSRKAETVRTAPRASM